MVRLAQDLVVTVCAVTRTTEIAAKRFGVGYFLPVLFVDRFSKLGGIDRRQFAEQLDTCRSFNDAAWADYWEGFANEQFNVVDAVLNKLGAPSVAALLDGDQSVAAEQLRVVAAPAATLFIQRGPRAERTFIREHPAHASAAAIVCGLVRAATYLFAASWPGWTDRRLKAYAASSGLFDVLLHAFAPGLGIEVERLAITVDGDEVVGYAIIPPGSDPTPAILMTNGLEGTVFELALPALAHRPEGTALFIMEMPGTFAYQRPMSADSERYYRAVLDYMSNHPRIDGDRLAMHGTSFGAHWSTRMAARDHRLKAVVSNGGPYHRAFALTASYGMPEIMASTLQRTVGASNPLDLGRRLGAMSLRDTYSEISIPILAVNGENDTLVPTQDTIDLAAAAPKGELKLYPNDDHCAMAHYDEATADAMRWTMAYLNHPSA